MTELEKSGAQTTIAARATAPGNGAIAILRISGPRAKELLGLLFVPGNPHFAGFESWKVHHGHLRDVHGETLDEVMVLYMPGPGTYTGEDCAEIFCHGGQAVTTAILGALFEAGAVPARRGEFSLRAYLNGRMDLAQAEAVAELVAAPGRQAMKQSLRRLDGELGRRVARVKDELVRVRVNMSLAVDFPEDEVEIMPREEFARIVDTARAALAGLLAGHARSRVLQEGARVVIAGAVNAGKSSLLNALVGRNRALVTDVPGTTRDFLEETALFGDLPVRLVDTAGVRESNDRVEALGIERTREQIDEAQCLLVVVDGAALGQAGAQCEVCPDEVARSLLERARVPVLVLWNKTDLCRPAFATQVSCPPWCGAVPFLCVSAQSGENLDLVCDTVERLVLEGLPPQSEGVAPNLRQAEDLRRAAEELDALARDIEAGQLYDLLSVHLDLCCSHLDDVVGVGTPEDVLNRVFESFCIGK